ncbi:MAG: hypothetical protein AB8B50_13335, partial [Pirellulaceae bacterium]
MNFRRTLLAAFLVFGFTLAALVPASTNPLHAAKPDSEAKDELTLEKLFPPKSLFGPSARSPEFSDDGRYAAYLYRPHEERRHGNDLWIYDFKESEARRITNIEVMSEFQRSARIVIHDRIKEHKKNHKADEADSEEEDSPEDEDGKDSDNESDKKPKVDSEVYLTVSESDADDDYRPAYSGISSFRWHPTENQLLLNSEGDIYLLEDLDKPSLERLTKTDERESQVQFLPDGSGYTVRRSDAV